MKFYKLLDFFDRLAYAHLYVEAVRKKELVIFGGYLNNIEKAKGLREFCADKSNGYTDVLILQKRVDKWYQRHAKKISS